LKRDSEKKAETVEAPSTDIFTQDLVALIPRLRRHARRLVGDVTAADDVVQDCLERAVASRAQFAAGSNLAAWAFTILHNVFRDGLRRERHWDTVSEDMDIPSRTWRGDSTAELALQVNNLSDALARLPFEQRTVVLMVGVEGLSYNDVSTALDIPLGTVMSRLHRAREYLRSAVLAPDYEQRATGKE
jgi:RNA polymerase sigma-70 factor (ECF subfamily)